MALLQEIKVPLLSVNDTTLTVLELPLTNGQHIKKGDLVMVLETSKTTFEIEAESDGYVQYLCEAGKDYEVNDIVAKVYSEPEEIEVGAPAITETRQEIISLEAIVDKILWEGETLFSIEAEHLIVSAKIDKSSFNGRDFVSKRDVEEKLGIVSNRSLYNLPPVVTPVKKSTPLKIDEEKVTIQKLPGNKKKEIEFLSDVQITGLTSTINTIVETDGIFVHLNPSLKYFRDSLLPVILYETGRLLKKYPLLNGYFANNSIAIYNRVNIGFAIDLDKGLKVLKIADTDQRSIQDIEETVMKLSEQYLDDQLQLDDLTDITFTITDLSSEEVSFFRPLVNMMNSAILGISSIDQKLNRCTLSITFDHRVTEGKYVAVFLKQLKNRLESYQSKNNPGHAANISCFKCYKTLQEDLSSTGFMKCITPEGKEAFICQSCIKGF